ncbi:MAG TPA: DUF3795 domain-containing protein [Caldisericia bacterium]|nr:DUF3795 domain-containing protein [Caldisericia bacterium]HXK52083.1 DUF3795 domain-containing protein [Caldisericia bacterium]
MKLTVCGANCSSCPELKQCGKSCNEHEGKPFYIQYEEEEVCPIYQCAVLRNGYQNCGECPELPCEIYYDWRDPDVSEEDHAKGIEKRTGRLKKSV